MDNSPLTKIAVIGLGYVGLPLSLQFARSGVQVLGLDIDPMKVEALNQGRSYIRHVSPESVAEQVTAGRLAADTDFARVKEVCIPIDPFYLTWKAREFDHSTEESVS